MVKRLSSVDQNNRPLTNVPTPSSGGDAVNKTYADTKAPLSHTHPASDLTATGTRDATTYLRGDNTWATVPTGATNLTSSLTATTVTINSDTGTDVVLAAADTTNAGIMTKAMFDKLNGIATGAEVNVNADWNSVSGDSQILNKPTTFAPSAHTHLVSEITASTTLALGVGSIELGHASDTTLSRSAAGVLAVEGVVVPTISSTNTFTNKTIVNGANGNSITGLGIAALSAITGTASGTTFLRGDGTWATPTAAAPSNMMTTDSTQTITSAGAKTFQAGALIMTSTNGTGEPYSDANPPQTLNLTDQASAPANPPAGQSTLYTTDGKILRLRDSDATDVFFPTSAQSVIRVVHGAVASTARPAGATYVEWVGSVAPTNANTTNDTWIDTA